MDNLDKIKSLSKEFIDSLETRELEVLSQENDLEKSKVEISTVRNNLVKQKNELTELSRKLNKRGEEVDNKYKKTERLLAGVENREENAKRKLNEANTLKESLNQRDKQLKIDELRYKNIDEINRKSKELKATLKAQSRVISTREKELVDKQIELNNREKYLFERENRINALAKRIKSSRVSRKSAL